MAEEKPEWMSIGEAAKYIGVSRDTLRRWEKRGRVEAIRSPTNRRYYTKKQLDRLMSGEKEKGVRRSGKKLVVNQQVQLGGIGFLSFAAAVILALLIQFFILR